MKNYHYFLIIILSIGLKPTFAHQNFRALSKYDSVTVRITTGYDYEEIKKVEIIGQLASKLAKSINYKGNIFLDFDHHYTEDCTPVYFISFDKGKIEYTFQAPLEEKDFLSDNAIVLRQVARNFDIETTLKLLEYSIHNLAYIKQNQSNIDYNKNYCQWRINTIDTTLIDAQLKKPVSSLVKDIMDTKIEQERNFSFGLSYYWKNNKYYFYYRDFYEADTVLLALDSIYYIEKAGNGGLIIFDSNHSFLYLNHYITTVVSKKHIIENTFGYYKPFDINPIGRNKASITFEYYTKEDGIQPKERTLLYVIDKDELLQDLDKTLNR